MSVPPSPVLPALPGLRGWLVWSVAVGAYIISVLNRTSLAGVGIDASIRFDADASALALFAVLQLAVYGGMQLPVGVLLDLYGSRPLMIVGMLVMALGQLTMAFAPGIGVAIVARMLLGAGDAMIFASALRLIATWFPAQRAPLMSQLTGIIGQLGQVLALIPLPALVRGTSWSIAFATVAATCVLFTVLIALVVRNRPPGVDRDIAVDTRTGQIAVVTSAIDTRVGIRAAWAHPGTRLAFWTHFTTPFAGTTFVMLWGVPFLTAGQGLSPALASAVTTTFVFAGMVFGPVMGAVSARAPMQRTRLLVLPSIALQALLWVAVLVWPGPAPLALLFVLVAALATGGPASMIAFDHARTHNPANRLSTATGITNVGGFVAALVAILLIGVLLDAQGAGRPENYSLDAFRVAFLAPLPLWTLGTWGILRERRLTRERVGLAAPRRRRPRS